MRLLGMVGILVAASATSLQAQMIAMPQGSYEVMGSELMGSGLMGSGGGTIVSQSIVRTYRVYRVSRSDAPEAHPYQPNPAWYRGQPLEGGAVLNSRYGAYRMVPNTPAGGYLANDGSRWIPLERVGTVVQQRWAGAATAGYAWRVRLPGNMTNARIPRTPPAEVLSQVGRGY